MIGTANEGKDQIKWNEMKFYLAFPSAAYLIQSMGLWNQAKPK